VLVLLTPQGLELVNQAVEQHIANEERLLTHSQGPRAARSAAAQAGGVDAHSRGSASSSARVQPHRVLEQVAV
jgi:hypothetical protein